MIELSIVVPTFNEADNVPELLTTYQFASNLGITAFQPILCIFKSNT